MTQPDEHLMAANSTAIQEPAPASGVQVSPVLHPPDHSYNPFRLIVPRTGPWQTLGNYLAKGGNIGCFLFWLIGILISVHLLVITPDRTWVDWILRPICFPVVLAMLGQLVGALVGLFAWIGHQIFHVYQ